VLPLVSHWAYAVSITCALVRLSQRWWQWHWLPGLRTFHSVTTSVKLGPTFDIRHSQNAPQMLSNRSQSETHSIKINIRAQASVSCTLDAIFLFPVCRNWSPNVEQRVCARDKGHMRLYAMLEWSYQHRNSSSGSTAPVRHRVTPYFHFRFPSNHAPNDVYECLKSTCLLIFRTPRTQRFRVTGTQYNVYMRCLCCRIL